MIVDDEPLARRGVISRLQCNPDVAVVGEAENGIQGLRLVKQTRPDVLFLDVKMPGMGGLEFAAQLIEEPIPYIIYLTAFDRYALQAFQVRALDYLLKPIDNDRFQDAVDRARKFVIWREQSEVTASRTPEPGKPTRHFTVRSGGRSVLIDAYEIDWIEALGDYARLHIGGESYLLRDSMDSLDRKLDQKMFLRIHRRTIIRLDLIRELVCLTNSDARIRLKDGTELRVSRTFRERLQKAMSSMNGGVRRGLAHERLVAKSRNASRR